MATKYLYYIDGTLEDVHGDNYGCDISEERAREIAKEYGAILLNEDGEAM